GRPFIAWSRATPTPTRCATRRCWPAASRRPWPSTSSPRSPSRPRPATRGREGSPTSRAPCFTRASGSSWPASPSSAGSSTPLSPWLWRPTASSSCSAPSTRWSPCSAGPTRFPSRTTGRRRAPSPPRASACCASRPRPWPGEGRWGPPWTDPGRLLGTAGSPGCLREEIFSRRSASCPRRSRPAWAPALTAGWRPRGGASKPWAVERGTPSRQRRCRSGRGPR
ncbi:hypothetical protein H632_c4953p0, partial [Helicosporidium sp. ATCC 50920]